jgi:chromosomal replication initiation ATPase DnaA
MLPPKQIIEIVAEEYDISVEDLLNGPHTKLRSRAHGMITYILVNENKMTFNRIAELLNRKSLSDLYPKTCKAIATDVTERMYYDTVMNEIKEQDGLAS